MNAIVIASIVVTGTLLLGALGAVLIRGFSNVVNQENEARKEKLSNLQPALTLGHEIPVDADVEAQRREARKLAAKRAAQLPRGSNVRIDQKANNRQATAFDGVDVDPVSAVRMAQFHGWIGLKSGTKEVQPVSVAREKKGVSEAVAPVKSSDDLVAGQDYPIIEITDDMTPAAKRKARIANAKAKSAAVKKLKESASIQSAMTSESVEPATIETQAPTKKATTSRNAPVAGVDYEVIEINDDMSPEDIRKARIANAKAKSAAQKRLKEAGSASSSAPPEPAAAASNSVTDNVAQGDNGGETDSIIPVDIPAPNYIEITDTMDNDEKRKARIHNAKEKSAFNKALKAAGIDPKTVQ